MLAVIIFKLKLIFIPCKGNNYRPKFLDSRFLVYYVSFLLVLKLIAVPVIIYLPKTVFFADITRSLLFEFTNKERGFFGLPSLEENPVLERAAYFKAKDMLEKDYFSHQSPEGVSPWYWVKEAGYNYELAGENLAIGFLDSEEVIRAWMESPLHKKNILGQNYKDIGLAVLKGDFQGNETTVVVQLFGASKNLPEPQEKEALIERPEQPEQKSIPAEIMTKKEAKEALIQGEKTRDETLTFNFFHFISFQYHNFIQRIIYGSLLFIIISLMLNIFIKIDIQHKDLIFKTLFFLILLILFIYLDKKTIIQFIPHNFNID